MGLMPLLVFSRQEGKRLGQLADDFGLKKPDIRYILISIPLGIAFYFATMVAAYIFNIILTLLGVFPRASDPMLAGVGPMIFTLLVSAVAPGIFEELFYRSTMQYSLTGTRDGGKKIVFMAMIFSLAHQYIYQTGYTFVGGIILGYLYYKTRSIYPAMIVHFMNNGIGILMEAIEVNGWNGGAIVDAYFSMDVGTLVLIGFVMAGVAFGLLVAIKKISDNKKKEQTMKAQLAGIPIATQQRHVPTPMEKAVWATGIALMLLNTLFTLFWAYV